MPSVNPPFSTGYPRSKRAHGVCSSCSACCSPSACSVACSTALTTARPPLGRQPCTPPRPPLPPPAGTRLTQAAVGLTQPLRGTPPRRRRTSLRRPGRPLRRRHMLLRFPGRLRAPQRRLRGRLIPRTTPRRRRKRLSPIHRPMTIPRPIPRLPRSQGRRRASRGLFPLSPTLSRRNLSNCRIPSRVSYLHRRRSFSKPMFAKEPR
jgi:hypothetical protein